MAGIRLERTLAAPIEGVFELLSDHAGYTRFRGITDARLVREGESERNGRGAIRSIATGPIRFDEEITAFVRPTRMDYVIRSANVPLAHDGGTIRLQADGAATRVLWISTFTATVPALKRAVGAAMAAAIKRGFVRMLDDTERLAAEP